MPRALSICPMKMMRAMPLVKPVITGAGMKLADRDLTLSFIVPLVVGVAAIAYTARRPGDRVHTGDPEFDARYITHASPAQRAAALCDPPLRAALAGLPRPYLMIQNGIVVLIWPWDKLPTDAQLDAAIACLQALAAHAAPAAAPS